MAVITLKTKHRQYVSWMKMAVITPRQEQRQYSA